MLSLVEIGPLVLKKTIFKFCQCIFTISLSSPLEIRGALHLNKLIYPSPKDDLCQVWLKLARWFWRRRWKCEMFTDGQTDRRTDRQTETDRQTDRQTNDRWSEKLTWAFSSGELKGKRSLFNTFCYNLQSQTCKYFSRSYKEFYYYWTRSRTPTTNPPIWSTT